MNKESFTKICDNQYDAVLKELRTKNADYAEEADAFANFYDDAKAMNISVYQAIGIHLNKQFRAIRRWLSGTELKSEDIKSRITDEIAYLMLLRGVIEQEERNAITL